MKLNESECNGLHFRQTNDCIESNSAEKDLGKLNMTQQCTLVAMKTTNDMLCFVTKSKTSRSREELICLYLALMRLYLQYCAWFWASHQDRNWHTVKIHISYWRHWQNSSNMNGKRLLWFKRLPSYLSMRLSIVWADLYLSQSSYKSLVG